MAIVLEWDDEAQTIIRMDLNDRWQWSDFRQSAVRIVELVHSVDGPVDVIFNTLPSAKPSEKEAIIHGQWVHSIWPHDRVAHVVVLTTQPMILALIQVFRRLFPDQMREVYAADSLERAREILQARHDD